MSLPHGAANRVARTALLAALASIQPSRRRPPIGFLIGDDPRELSRYEAIEALTRLPKTALLQVALRTDGIVCLRRPRMALAEVVQRHVTSTEGQQAREAESRLPSRIQQLFARARRSFF